MATKLNSTQLNNPTLNALNKPNPTKTPKQNSQKTSSKNSATPKQNSKHQKPKIKMKIVDWYEDVSDEIFYENCALIRILSQKYDIINSDNPDFVIAYCYGNDRGGQPEVMKHECVRIYHGTECLTPDFNIYDYALHQDYIDFDDRYLHFPSWAWLFFANGQHRTDYVFTPRHFKNDRFCAFLSSNGGTKSTILRDRFFEKLSLYKRVDSGGHYKNNIGGAIDSQYSTDGFLLNKMRWLSNYKFAFAFENTQFPGYISEKLFDAYSAGCVPIYWGDTSLRVGVGAVDRGYDSTNCENIDTRLPKINEKLLDYKLNPKAFINAHDFVNLDELLEEVKRIDNDEKAYAAMRNENLFLGDFDPKAFYEKRVLDFFDKIFAQGPELAKRRGEGQRLEIYRSGLYGMDLQARLNVAENDTQTLHSISRKALKVALFYTKISRKLKKIYDKVRRKR